MKKMTKTITALSLLFLLSLLIVPEYRARAEAAWQVLCNGKVTNTQMIETDSGAVVSVTFPVPAIGETQSYGVLLETDPANKQVKITRVKKKGPLRERGDCPKCVGSKDCQDCYPTGSGVGTNGEGCYTCNASGECVFCSGSGDCYSCDGDGFPTGCNTCGDVSGN